MKNSFVARKFSWLRDAWHLAKPFWTGSEKYKAYAWFGLIIILSLIEVYMTVLLNKWHNGFYNTIQNYDKVGFLHALQKVGWIIFFYAAVALAGYYFSSILEIKWRTWLTNFYLNDWFGSKSYYKSRFTKSYSDNPDQRISEDLLEFVQLTYGLFMGAFKAFVSLCSFVIILWGLSGTLKFVFWHHKFSLPGYMVWLAVGYALLGSYIIFKIGRPLIKLTYQQQMYEADFRYNLVRIREYAEHVASYNGDEIEKKILTKDFDHVVSNFMQRLNRNLKITLFNFTYSQISEIVPIIISSIRYFAKEITLGSMMQVTFAFGKVESAVAYFVFSYTNLASWRAVMDRLLGFKQMVADVESLPDIAMLPQDKNYLEVRDLQIQLPSGESLLGELSLALYAGDRLLIQGPVGSGKTTLLRALNGLWPFVSGEIYKNPKLTSLFISQKPYLPKASLRDAICYPKAMNLPNDQEIIDILTYLGLPNLGDRLDEVRDWGAYLSLGEQQKIAFCRIMINKPDILYLDEVTSALDGKSEEYLYTEVIKHFPNSLIISVGHRPTLEALHTKVINAVAYGRKDI